MKLIKLKALFRRYLSNTSIKNMSSNAFLLLKGTITSFYSTSYSVELKDSCIFLKSLNKVLIPKNIVNFDFDS